MAENKQHFIEDLEVGMSASFAKVLGDKEISTYVDLTGDNNPVHVNDEFARGTMFKARIAHGMLTASLISNILGTKLPGTGAIYLSQSVRFLAPVFVGDEVSVTATVTDLDAKRRIVTLSCTCQVGEKQVLSGEAKAMVPSRKQG